MADGGTFSGGVQWAIDFLQGAVVPLLLTLGLVYFLWGITKYVTAGGDEDKMKEGKNLVVYGIIALFVMISVFGFVRIQGTKTVKLWFKKALGPDIERKVQVFRGCLVEWLSDKFSSDIEES